MAEDANANIRVDIDTTAALASIKNLQRQISAFHTNMAKGGAAAAATSLNLQQGLLNSINRTGQFSATIKNVKSTTESFTTALEKNKLSMREYFRYSGAATKTFGRFFRTEFDTINKVARERVKDLQTQYIKMGRDANGALKSIAVRPLALDMESLSTKTQIAAQRQALLNQMLKQGSTNLLNFGKNTQWAGRQLMVGFTVPLTMFGTVAAKTFMDMEKQAIRFKRVYGEMFTTTEETNKALQEIKNLASEFTKYGVAVEKTMELAADVAATGKMGAELTAQVANATRLAVLGGVEQAEALQATISLTDAFGTSAEQLSSKINFLNAVENQTITSIEDLTVAIPKAGPVVQQLGGDVEDLTFFLTAMREGGINASEGANALKSGLASLINPTGVASEMLQGFGINLKGIVDANRGNVKGIVIDFAKALDTLDPLNRAQAIEQLFGKFQFARLSTLFQNVIKEGNQASRVLKLTNATTEELAILSERELKKVEDSPMFKFQKAIEDIKVTLVPLGEAFLKAVTPVLEFGTKILEKFNDLDAGAKQFVVGLTAIAGVIGPVFLMGFGLIANGVANVVKMFTFFKTAMNKAGTASTELGMQTDYMTQQQLEASAIAASLNQVHQTLTQTFTSEAAAINNLTAAYRKTLAAQNSMVGGVVPRTKAPKKYASGVLSVPGPKGAGDVVPAMLSPGEAIIPAKQAKKYSGIISSLIADNVPGYFNGTSSVGVSNDDIKSKLRDRLRSSPSQGFSEAFKDLGYGSFAGEEKAFLDTFKQELLKENPGMTQTDFQKKVRNYFGYDLSHLRESSRLVKLSDGTRIPVKNWETQNIIKEARAVNQILENISSKGYVDSSGKNLGRGSFIPNLSSAEIAKMAGVSEAIAKQELQNLKDKIHPTSPNATKVLRAVAQKYGGPRGTALAKMLQLRLSDKSPGSFFNAIKGGLLSIGERPEITQKALKSQETTIKNAESRMVSSTAGVPKPSNVSRKGGSPRDTRVVAASPGEVILSNKSVKAIKRGGTARVGRWNFGNVIPGREDGVPSNQRQRGPDGRFVSNQSQAAAGGSKTKRFGMSGGTAGMVASGAVMAGSMMPGPIGKMSQDLMMPVMLASTILPMLKGPVQIAVAALTAIAVAGFALKGAFDEAQDKSMKVAEAMGGGQKAIEAYAEFAGNVSSGQIMDRRRSQALSPFTTKTGKTTFGESFVQSEQGQALTSSTRESISTVGKAGTQSQLINQLVTAVSSGALDTGQARSIVANLATEIGDASFGMSVNAKLIELLGPNGENLVKDPLAIRVKMAEDTRRQVAATGQNMQNAVNPVGRLGQAALQTGAMAGTGAMIGAAVSGPLAPVGAAVGAVAGTVAGIALNAGSVVDSFVKMGTASGAVVASGILALQQQQEMLDSLDLEYERRIESAKAAGDVEEAERLTTEHIRSRQALLDANAKTTAAVLDNYAKAGFVGQGAMGQAVDKAIEQKYADDPIMQAMALGAKDQIVAASGLDQTQEYQMKLLVATGDLDPLMVSQLLNNFSEDGAQLTNVLNLMTNLGSAEGNKAIQIMNMFQDKDGNPLKEQQTKFIADVSTKTPAEAKKYLELFAEISKTSGILDAEVVLSFYNNNPKAAAQYQAMLDKINAVDGKMTMDFVQNLIGESQFEQFKKNQAYFESLDPVQQKDYLSVFTNTMQLKGDPDMQKAYRLWLTEPGNAKKMFEEFAIAKSVQVTEARANEAKAAAAVEEPTSGGGGRKADPLDNILKALQNVRKASIDALGGTRELFRLFEDGKNISVFKGIENQLLQLTSNTDFSNFIAGLDKQEQGLFITIKNGNVELTKRGALLEKAYRAKSIGDFVLSQQQLVLSSKDELTARNLLIQAGYSYAKAVELSRDADIAAAYASAAATKGAEARKKAIEDVTKALKQGLAAQEANRSLEEIFDDGFNKAMEAFEAEEKRLTLEFEVKVKADKALVAAAENEIAKIQYIIDDYDADLRGIEDQEEKINKTYADKLEALEKVRVANQKILEQEKGKLSVAEAITRGDLYAAAQAAQQVRETSASGYFASQTSALEAGRERALGQVRGAMGLSREQIQQKIKDLSDQIFFIEEKTLEPANERIRLAQIELDKQIASITVLGRTKVEWETVKNSIDLAKVSSDAYKKAMEEALRVVEQLKLAWDTIQSKTVTLGVDDQTGSGGAGAGGKGGVPAGVSGLNSPQSVADRAASQAAFEASGLSASGYIKMIEAQERANTPKQSAQFTKAQIEAQERAAAAAKPKIVVTGNATTQRATVAAPVAKPSGPAPGRSVRSYMANGGLVNYMSNGGAPKFARPSWAKTMGTDRIPAMLTPGEFVISRPAVSKIGVKSLNSMNNGEYPGGSVYNYNLSVNVSSMSDPNDIAQTVMAQIRRVESQRIRSNRF